MCDSTLYNIVINEYLMPIYLFPNYEFSIRAILMSHKIYELKSFNFYLTAKMF